MRPTKRQMERLIDELEREIIPQHHHQPMVKVSPGDDADELLARAQEECRLVGCPYAHHIVPRWKPLEEWADGEWEYMVRREYEGW